jgi:hypothetical protein
VFRRVLWEDLRVRITEIRIQRLALGVLAGRSAGDMGRFHASTGLARLFHIASQSFVYASDLSQLSHGCS